VEGVPDPSLVVLMGPSGAGKSTWAAKHFRPEEIISSDRLRAVVGTGEHDLEASNVAFSLLDQMVEARLRRRLLTVVDTLGLDDERRARQLALARELDLPAVLVVFAVPEQIARLRNRSRERPVPASVLTSQIKRFRQITPRLEADGWRVITADDDLVITSSHGPITSTTPAPLPTSRSLRFYLQVSRFIGEDPLATRLASMGRAAEEAGFTGLALMDHLVQIPQVGREWEDLPEPYTSLSYLAGVTSQLELGALVSGVSLRNPALLAKMVATLDVLSGGRAFCGLGLGWNEAELKAYGYVVPPIRERRDIFEDTLNILPLMWGPGKATYHGKVHSVVDASCYPRPLHSIPVIAGGRGDRTLTIAARLADGANLRGTDKLAERLDFINSQLRRCQRDPAQFEVSVLDLPLIGRDRTEVAAMVEKARGRIGAGAIVTRHHAGTPQAHIDRFKDLATLGVSAVFVAPVGMRGAEDLDVWKDVIGAFT